MHIHTALLLPTRGSVTGYRSRLVSVSSSVFCRLRYVYYIVGVGVCTWQRCQDFCAIILFRFHCSPAVFFPGISSICCLCFTVLFSFGKWNIRCYCYCSAEVTALVYATTAPFVLFVNQSRSMGWKCHLIYFFSKGGCLHSKRIGLSMTTVVFVVFQWWPVCSRWTRITQLIQILLCL